MGLLIVSVIVAYSLFVIVVGFGVYVLLKQRYTFIEKSAEQEVSVIIPFRDEAERIRPLLQSIKTLNYPLDKFEVIFVDDHSSDESIDIINELLSKQRIKYKVLSLPSEFSGKKSAIEFALFHANTDYVLFTDADCELSPLWLKSMVNTAINTNAEMVLGPVAMTGNSTVAKFQIAEFLSLQFLTIGTAGINRPVLSNAANMLIKLETLNEFDDPFRRQVSSGDDVFLMEKLRQNNKTLAFSIDSRSLVKTPACEKISDLLIQRSRWLSKTKRYDFNFSLLVASFFGVLQILVFLVMLFALIAKLWLLFLGVFLAKFLFDFISVKGVAFLYQTKVSFISISILSLVYPLWTIFSSLISFIIEPVWKGRIVKV